MAAGALIPNLFTGAPSPIKVDVADGDTLKIGFEESGENSYENVTPTGPAVFTFEGEIDI